MNEFDIQRCTRRCAKTQRELKPGELFLSTLVAEGKDVVRYDYSEEAWSEPPENAIGWWKSRLPDAHSKTVSWAPNDVILNYFEQLEGDPANADVRYVLGLLMIRRRIVRLEETETDSQGSEVLVLYCPKNETEYRVVVTEPSVDRVAEIQEELSRLLFADAK